MNNYYKIVTEYFNNKSAQYDDVDNQLYWVLSDEFYKEVLRREVFPLIRNKKKIQLLDAGAGTGRWTLFFNELFSKDLEIMGTLVDVSSEMLRVASEKIKHQKLDKIFKVKIGNIENMPEIPEKFFDVALSFYNVISFVEHPSNALFEISKKLKSGGIHVAVVANKYHALYFAILTGRGKEIERILSESKVAFNDIMPPIHCFSPNELTELYRKSGYKNIRIFGGPNFIYPGMEETFVKGETEQIRKTLADNQMLQKILDTELAMYAQSDIIGRANTLLVIAEVE